MHILYLHQHFTTPSGSGGTRSYEMARKAITRGHRVTMICGGNLRSGLDLPEIRPGLRRGDVDGIEVYQFLLPYSNHLSLLKRSSIFLKYAIRSSLLALQLEYDLLFATSTPLTAGIPGIAMKLAWRRKKFIFEARDLWPELPKAMGVVKNPLVLWGMGILEWSIYRTSDGCVGLAPGIVKGIQNRASEDLPVVMVPNGCDLGLFKPKSGHALMISGINPGDFVALFAGAHGIANGLDAILNTARILKVKGEKRIKILLIGNGNQKKRLQEQAEQEDLDNVVFQGLLPKAEIAKVVSAVDCGLQILANVPAFYYGTSPNKFFDYISGGCPVITNYPGWIADMVTKYQCGIAVGPNDPESFASALIKMAGNSDFCAEMSINGRRLAESKFDRQQLTDKWINFLESISEGKS